jgi:hypothetical protein
MSVSGLPERLGAFGLGRLRIQTDVAQQMLVQRGQLTTLATALRCDTDNGQHAGKDIAAAQKGKSNLELGHFCLL